MKTKQQEALRMYVRARMDFQDMRKRMDNRLGKKADGSDQNIQNGPEFAAEDYQNFMEIRQNANSQEKAVEKMLRELLKKFPVYNEFLSITKGVKEIAAGWIIGEIDIKEASTVSKIWQYAGLNPGMVKGKKRMPLKDHTPTKGKITQKMKNIKTGGMDCIVETDEMIRGDKRTPGFVLPYNKNFKTFLLGVLATRFIMSKSYYALEFYYPYKERLKNSQQVTKEVKKGGKIEEKPWGECTPGHRDQAAKRYMIKQFLKDLYAVWRDLEGLPVRPPYGEEYLGKKHSA